jgi:phosphoglycolate phosphatase
MGGKELIEIALGREVNIQENLQSFRSLYLADQLELDQLYPGVLEYMKWLRQNGLKIGICTNKPDRIVEKMLKQQGIMNYIDYLVADDGFRPKKPNPQGLLQILASAKLNADQAIMIGDSSVDQIAAKLANIKFIFHQSGYDDGVLVEKNTIVIKSYFELIGKKNE